MRKVKHLFLLVFVVSLLFIPGNKVVKAETLPGYGASISEYKIKTTKDALAKYKKKKVYYISASSAPLKSSGFKKYGAYNKNTRNYYTIRSYMEKFEKSGGGTLVLKKGEYKISNTIYVPSNVTMILEDGARISKSTKTGTKKMEASRSMFHFVSPKKAKKQRVVTKHNGSKNINVIGVGEAVIDLKYANTTIGLVLGHNQNVVVSGITFKNMNNGHFFEVDATKNIVIDHCTFSGVKNGSDYVKEAINIDTPDDETKGFSCRWSSRDKTPNEDMRITNCVFRNVGRAIGTHKYSAKGNTQMMHSGIVISNNIITNMYNDGPIRVMNWRDSMICNNTITDIEDKDNPSNNSKCRAILLSGTNNMTVNKNYVARCGRAFQFIAWKNTGPGSKYPGIKDELSVKNKTDLKDNHAEALYSGEYFTRITTEYKVYTNAEKIPFTVE